ncbi:MAG TPA: twin transmembrane helix small protein [Aliidongia sp.]|nr:twin transmembrane helix small protein [Aliidongia sp.]
MNTVFVVAIILALLATLGVLAMGIVQLFRGGNPRRSNQLMRWRIILQFTALMLFMLFMLFARR